MSKVLPLKKLIRMLAGTWKRALTTCVVVAVVVFVIHGYMVARSASFAAVGSQHLLLPKAKPQVTVQEPSAKPPSPPAFESRRPAKGEYTIGDANIPVHPMGLFSEHTASAVPFPIDPPKKRFEELPAWWKKPQPLTKKEIGFQRYFSSITWKLKRKDWYPLWDVGGNQNGLQSIRFYAAFLGYAAIALGMRTPAYPGLTKKIVLSAIEHLLDREAWSYIRVLWKDKPWFPDPAANENIMYTGHLLQLMVSYEVLTNDSTFRKKGFDFVWDKDRSFHYDIMSLVDVTVKQMRENPSGGVACEPKHVFVSCNTHPHVALRTLEKMGLGDWSKERDKWENWFLKSCYDDLGNGAVRGVYHQDKKKFFPVGFPGGDGWGLMWYHTWASDPAVPNAIWRIARSRIKWEDFVVRPNPVVREERKFKTKADFVSYLSAIVHATLPGIPTATFLYPAAVACGDIGSAVKLRHEIEKRFLRQRGGMVFLKVPHRYQIGCNANMALGLALENGSNMRHFVQRPLPRKYFKGPLVEDVRPDNAVILQAYREKNDLMVEFSSTSPVSLVLKNVPAIRKVEGLNTDAWTYENNTLHISKKGQRLLRIIVER